jgi:hypothetical protein
VAVVFLWALAFQLLAQGVAGLWGRLGEHHGVTGLAARVIPAVLLLVLGESLRRGNHTALCIDIVLLWLVAAAGLLLDLALAMRWVPVHYLPSMLIMVTVAPWIAWRLSLPRTAAWFAVEDGGRRRCRAPHIGRSWVLVMFGLSSIAGVAVALSQAA